MERESTLAVVPKVVPLYQDAHWAPKDFAPDTPIRDIVRFVVVDKLACKDVDFEGWVKLLTSHLITDLGLLCRVSPGRLEKLGLPLLLEEELIHIIKSSQGKYPIQPLAIMKTEGPSSRQKLKHADEHRSAFLGLTEKERQTILECWNMVLEERGKELDTLFEKFYQTFFRLDNTARRLFQGKSLEKQSRSLTKVIKMIMSCLEDPTTMLPYVQKLGTRHLIYGINQKDFQSWAIAFTQTLSEFIPQIMTPSLKEAWFVLIIKLGQTMTECYDEVSQGLRCYLGRTNDKEKKKLFCLLTHQSIAIYKDEEMSKEITTIWIKWITDIDVVIDEKHTKYYPYCFCITIGDIKFYYGVDTKEDLSWWIAEVGERVSAHNRIAEDDDENDDSASASELTIGTPISSPAGISKKEMAKLKKLKKKLIKSTVSHSTTSLSSLKD